MRSRVVAELVALFAPPGCAGCRAPLADAAEAVCASCRRELPWLRGARCRRCALAASCVPCPARNAAFDRAWAPLAYAGPARSIVASLKFDGALALADLMAAQLAAAAPAGVMRGVLVPVPAHPLRVRRRGFDQAHRLAEALGRRTGLALDACLRRAGTTEPQSNASGRRRMRPGRIHIAATGPVPDTALLVDDVHTTGATLDAAARALKRAGAKQVHAVTYARTLKA